MLYCNQTLVSRSSTFLFGKVEQVFMGEAGQGRKCIALTCPENTIIHNGMNHDLTIGITRKGYPRLIRGNDSKCYFLLSSHKASTRRGNGRIMVLKSQIENFDILLCGNGAGGINGRTGRWDCLLFSTDKNSEIIIRVQPSGGGYGIPSKLYILKDGRVLTCTLPYLKQLCNSINMEIPCEIRETRFGIGYSNDWQIL